MTAMIIMFLSACVSMDGFLLTQAANGNKPDLEKFGTDVMDALKNGNVDWHAVSLRCADTCTEGATQFRENGTPVRLSGKEMKDFLESVKYIYETERRCLYWDKSEQKIFASRQTGEIDTAISCLRGLKYEPNAPAGVHPFYMDVQSLFSKTRKDGFVKKLEETRAKVAIAYGDQKVSAQKLNDEMRAREEKRTLMKQNVPAIPAAAELVEKPALRAKTYRIFILPNQIGAGDGDAKGFSFNYSNTGKDDADEEGFGSYHIRCRILPACRKIGKKMQDAEPFWLEVRVTGETKEGVNALSQVVRMPVLEVVKELTLD